MRTLLLGLFFTLSAHAETPWLCSEEASQKEDNVIRACGLASDPEESKARSQAFDEAKAEFNRVCQMSADCQGRKVNVKPLRTECERSKGLYNCRRLVAFTIDQKGPEDIRFYQPKIVPIEGNLTPSEKYLLLSSCKHCGPHDQSLCWVTNAYKAWDAGLCK